MLDVWPPATARPWPVPAAAAVCGVTAVLAGREDLLASISFGALALACAGGGMVGRAGSVRLVLLAAGAVCGAAAVATLPSAAPAAERAFVVRGACGLVLVVCTAAGVELNRRGPWSATTARGG